MNILLTGSNGFLGRIIYSCLKDFNLIFDLPYSNFSQKIRLNNEIPFFNNYFDLVIHAAGKAHVIPQNNYDFENFFEVNVKGTANLLTGLKLSGTPKQFVFISSVAVYGKEFGNNICEKEKLNAKDPYGLSKIEAENLVINWCKENGVVCTILRLPLLVGKNPPGNLGSMVKAIKFGYYFNIDGGRANKSMVLAHDVARFIPIIAPIGGVYNLTDGLHPTFKDLSTAISKKRILNLPMPLAILLGRLGDFIESNAPLTSMKIKKITSDLTFDDSKARTFGWNPQSVIKYLKQNDLTKFSN